MANGLCLKEDGAESPSDLRLSMNTWWCFTTIQRSISPVRTLTTSPRVRRTWFLRAHINLGHPSAKEFVRLLKAAGTRNDIIEYVLKEFICEGCLKQKRQPTRLPAATPRTYDFNVVIGVDLLFVNGAVGQEEHPVLNVTCVGTLYSTFSMVHATRKTSALVWATFLRCWLRVFGSPSFIIMDQGLEFQGAFVEGVESHGIQPILIDRDAPHQNGITERRGGLFKEVYYKTKELYQPSDVNEVQDMIHEVSWALQTMTNRSGYSPAQRVLGKQPSLQMELLNDVGEYQFPQTMDSSWKKSEEIRAAARKALMEVDCKERLQRAVRARPRRAREDLHFVEGDPVYVWRQGKRGAQAKVGPCFVVLQKGETVWVTRRGELWKCNKAQVFHMGNLERQGLEAIPAELLKAKEKIRFQSEKMGYIDVEKEGDPPMQQQPQSAEPAAAQPNVIQRRAPPTPRAPPEGLGTPNPSTPLPARAAPLTPAIQRAVPGTPVQHQPPQAQAPEEIVIPDTPSASRSSSITPTPTTPLPDPEADHERSRSPTTRHNVPTRPVPPSTTPLDSLPQQPFSVPEQRHDSLPQQPTEVSTKSDELWKATLENTRARQATASTTQQSPAPAAPQQLMRWSRIDLGAKRFRASNSQGPLWGDVRRRVTIDLDTLQWLADETIDEGLSVHQLHKTLPIGVENIETILVYEHVPGHPNPGEPYTSDEDFMKGVKPASSSKMPEEDSRLVDINMKRGLENPTPSDRQANRSKVFGIWRADDVTEWGDKRKFPVVANSRDLNAFPKLSNNDYYLALKDNEFPLSYLYLTKQSGKELEEKKLTKVEKELFNKAKTLEINNLINSNAIAIVTDEKELQEIKANLATESCLHALSSPRSLEKLVKIGKPRQGGFCWVIKTLTRCSWNVMLLHHHLQLSCWFFRSSHQCTFTSTSWM